MNMKPTYWLRYLFGPTVVAALFAGLPAITAQESQSKEKPKRADIYDTKADGEKQIEEALKIAKAENKRVLLQLGANWCVWCHQLHKLFKENERIAARLKESYVLVLIDVDSLDDGTKHNAKVNEKYGDPIQHGLPVLVLLDADGTQLTTQNTEPWEVEDHHDPEKVLAFLDKWAPAAKRGP
jgi:thioredoxin-related protein